jgi:hypothetical protein
MNCMEFSSSAFQQRLEGLSGDEITSIAACLRNDLDSVDGELAWWRATLAVSGALRRHRRTRQASVAAHRASQAVLAAAASAGLDETHFGDITSVARAAAEVARAVVAGDGDAVPHALREPLLHAWLGIAA